MSYKHFFLDTSENNKPLLVENPILLYSGFVTDEPEWCYKEHSHPFCEVIYICGGSGEFIINGTNYTGSEGDILIYNEGTLHEERSNPANPLKTYFCGIANINLSSLKKDHIIPDAISPVIKAGKYSTKFETYISDLIKESSNKISGYETVCSNLLSSIIIFILRVAGIAENETHLDFTPKLSNETKEYIDKYYSQNITLLELAKNLYISKYYLSHVFKNDTGFSPIQYLMKRRIEEAKKLLLFSDFSVNEIALTVGYEDPNYFSVIFKKAIGSSPIQYRKNGKK